MEAMEALEDAVPSVAQLHRDFVAEGGSEAEWIDVMNRPSLESWARKWFKAGEPEANKQIEELAGKYFIPNELIEYIVRDDDNRVTGYALGAIKEARIYRSQISLKVRHIHSNDPQFDNWAALHLSELEDFHLHICKKKPGACKVNCPNKDLGWFHVAAFRMMTYLDAFAEGYDEAKVYQDLRKFTEEHLADIQAERKGREVSLVPRRSEDRDRGLPVEMPEKKGRSGETKHKGEEKEAQAALGMATSKAGDQGLKGHGDEKKFGGLGDARDLAAKASAALGARHPQMFQRPRGDYGGDRSRGPQVDWLDNISAPGEEDRYPDPGGDRNRGQDERSGPSGFRGGGKHPGGGPPSDDSGKDKKDKKEKDKKKKRSGRSSSDDKKDRRKAAMAKPVKDKEKKRKRDGDPGDGSEPSSDGGRGKDDSERNKRPRRGDWLSPSVKEEKKKKRRRRRRRRSSRSSSSPDASTKSEDGFYGKGSSRYESLAEKARRHPGKLLRSGLEQMAKYVAARSGDGHETGVSSWREQRVGAYLNQVLFTQHSQEKIGIRNVRELVTLAEAIDLLMENNLPAVGDVLMQRMKALESSLTEGWQMATHQELIPPARASLTTDMERSYAAKQALQLKKLQENVKKRG